MAAARLFDEAEGHPDKDQRMRTGSSLLSPQQNTLTADRPGTATGVSFEPVPSFSLPSGITIRCGAPAGRAPKQPELRRRQRERAERGRQVVAQVRRARARGVRGDDRPGRGECSQAR